MNWEAMGAIGEIVGAIAVVTTLIFLVLQLKQNTQATNESNQLQRAAAVDRHTDSIGRWRTRLSEHPDLAEIWMAAVKDEQISELSQIRLDHLWIDLINLQRANYVRASIVGEAGLAKQASLSIAVEISRSKLQYAQWESARPWHYLVSPDFVAAVETELKNYDKDIYFAGVHQIKNNAEPG